MSRVWFSGLETGDWSEWSLQFGITFPEVQSTILRSGNYAAKLTENGDTWAASKAGLNLSTAYFRFYVYLSALPAVDGRLGGYNATGGGNHTAEVWLETDGTVTIRDNNLAVATGTIQIAATTWYYIELKVVIGSSIEARVDGSVSATATATGAGTVDSAFIQLNSGAATTAYFDDIAIDDTDYCGSGRIIARQGLAGSPTYDTWTKNGAATAALCWSDTPFSTATNCSDNVLADTQTMLVAPFNVVQSGHGSDTVGATDTINACKVAIIAKTAVAGNLDIIRRYSGADTATTVALTTSDAYYDSGIFTTTVANINSAEIGGKNDLVATLETIEDAWFIVDYTPSTTSLAFSFDQISSFFSRKITTIAY